MSMRGSSAYFRERHEELCRQMSNNIFLFLFPLCVLVSILLEGIACCFASLCPMQITRVESAFPNRFKIRFRVKGFLADCVLGMESSTGGENIYRRFAMQSTRHLVARPGAQQAISEDTGFKHLDCIKAHSIFKFLAFY